jgi:hypothetical protein
MMNRLTTYGLLLFIAKVVFLSLLVFEKNLIDYYRKNTSEKTLINSGSRGKAPPFVPVPYEPVLKGPPRGRPGERMARELWYRFVIRTGTKGWLLRQGKCINLCRGREFRV